MSSRDKFVPAWSSRASKAHSRDCVVPDAAPTFLATRYARGFRPADVQRSLQQSSAGLAFKEPKTAGSRRLLALDADTIAELRAYRVRQSERRLALGAAWQDNDLVCAGHFGEPWRPDTMKRAYERMRDRHGFTARFHDLRHSHASQLIRAGAPAKVIQERLGHASAGFTLTVYGHLLPGMQAESVERLGTTRAEARAKLAAEG